MQQSKLLTITIQFHFLEGLYFGHFGLWSLGSPPTLTDLSGSQSHPQIQGLMLTFPMLGQGMTQDLQVIPWDRMNGTLTSCLPQ